MAVSNIFYRLILSAFLLLLYLTANSCHREEGVVSSVGDVNETPYGRVEKVDDYPLYVLNYTADYEFDEYLHTGRFPNYTYTAPEGSDYNCTCFAAFGGENRIVGRNYDWPSSSSYFLVFTDPPDGYASAATVDLEFFEYDHNLPPDSPENLDMLRMLPYFPFDGMNEKGVAVGMNALSHSQGPYDGSKVTIGELQLIRLVLDYASSTAGAIELIENYNVRMEDPPIHYLIADASGHSAVIEFIDGEMIVMDNLSKWQVTTNFIITGLDDHDNAPCWRYRTTYNTLSNSQGQCSEDNALNILSDASVPSTRWSNIFNLKTGKMQIAMGRQFSNFHEFNIQ